MAISYHSIFTGLQLILLPFVFLTPCQPSYSADKFGEPHDNPMEPHIEFRGTIEPSLQFNIRLVYNTSSKEKACISHNPLAGITTQQQKSFYYSPTIIENAYSIQIPIVELHPNSNCGWEPSTVWICTAPGEQSEPPRDCGGLLTFQGSRPPISKIINFSCLINEIMTFCSDDHEGSSVRAGDKFELNIKEETDPQKIRQGIM